MARRPLNEEDEKITSLIIERSKISAYEETVVVITGAPYFHIVTCWGT
jgi:hypothetical protein